ncbi:MAG TPA: hypothetical protein VGD75_08605, partial [Bradyrhizobium sp.]
MPTIFVARAMVGTLAPSLVELRRTGSLCPPYAFASRNDEQKRSRDALRPSFANSFAPKKE